MSGWSLEQRRALSDIVRTSIKLEHLSLTNVINHSWAQDLLRHKEIPLKSLRLHQDKPNFEGFSNTSSLDYVQDLVEVCPGLQTLGFDLPRTSATWSLDGLSNIARLFCSLVHVEVYVDIRFIETNPRTQAANIVSVRQLWDCLWRNMALARKEQHYTIARPSLRTLRVFEAWDQETQDPLPGIDQTRRSECATFEARLSERDDLADKGYAEVVCLELEGLREKRGNEPARNEHQAQQMREMISRAEVGPSKARKVKLGASAYPHLRPLRTSLVEMAEEW
ncbi:MAG: hypothetical protein Q9220_004070 [cf. Caloplaca sp. 1 TL-2023]